MSFEKRSRIIEDMFVACKMDEFLSQYINTKADTHNGNEASVAKPSLNSSDDSSNEEDEEDASIEDELQEKRASQIPSHHYRRRRKTWSNSLTKDEMKSLTFQTYVKRRKVPTHLNPSFALDEQSIEQDVSLLCK